MTKVGEIVDFSCYLQLGKHGEKHRSCGQKCVENSQPAGLLTQDGTLYMLMPEEHDPRRDGGVDALLRPPSIWAISWKSPGPKRCPRIPWPVRHRTHQVGPFMRLRILAGALVPAFFLSAAAIPQKSKTAMKRPTEPLGLVPVIWPRDNPYSPEKAELGRYLYFDPRLSADGSVSCATCHNPKYAFTDGAAVSTGIKGQKGGRSAPTVINRA